MAAACCGSYSLLLSQGCGRRKTDGRTFHSFLEHVGTSAGFVYKPQTTNHGIGSWLYHAAVLADSNPSTIRQAQQDSFNNPKHSDVVFMVENEPIYANVNVLSEKSDYFAAMFRSNMRERALKGWWKYPTGRLGKTNPYVSEESIYHHG